MRNIEIGKYTCPRCNASLLTIAEDLMCGIQMTTRYKCAGCHEEYYSIEYINTVKQPPELKCPFCKKPADYFVVSDSWVDYWKCLPCRSTFEQMYTLKHEGLTTIQMYTNIRNKLYVLRQFLSINKSRIEMLPENIEDTVVIAQDFAFLLPSVTPENIQEKLMTYLVFS